MIDIPDQQALLLAISRKLPGRLTAYAIGGTAMMFHGLKEVTKDIDLVFLSENERMMFSDAARNLGYSQHDAIRVYGAKEHIPLMLSRKEKGERFDLFLEDVIDFTFSQGMIQRARSTHEFGKSFVLKVADPHDIILMKCATSRIRDKEDIIDIIAHATIDWDIIVREAIHQLELERRRAIFDLAELVDDLQKRGVDLPSDLLSRLLKLLESGISSQEQKRLGQF